MFGVIGEIIMWIVLICGVCWLVAWGIVTMAEEIWKMFKR